MIGIAVIPQFIFKFSVAVKLSLFKGLLCVPVVVYSCRESQKDIKKLLLALVSSREEVSGWETGRKGNYFYYMKKIFNRVCITYLKPKYFKNSTTLILQNERPIPG